MKILALTILFFAAHILSGQASPPRAASKPDPKSAPQKRHPDGRPLGIPFSAVKISDGAWRAIEDGKPIIYRSTPFGFSKVSEEENGRIQRLIEGRPDSKTEVPEGVSVLEVDGKLHFSRITPFGNYKWIKDKSELNAVEKAVWEQHQKQSSQGASKQ